MNLLRLFALALALALLSGCATNVYIAAAIGDIKTVRQALDQGQNVNAVSKHGSLLYISIVQDDAAMVALIVEKGADVNAAATRGFLRETPLHTACFSDNPEIARILLENGADIHAGNILGWTPLHNALISDCPGIAQVLLTHGADPMAVDNEGNTPLHFVAKALMSRSPNNDNAEMARKLLALGVDPNAVNKYGRTPLHEAAMAMTNKGTFMQVLVEADANPSLRDVNGKTSQELLQAKFLAVREKQRQARIQAEQERQTREQRQAQASSSGFQWGKLAALAAGAAIGGIDNLDAATQAELIGGMVTDSMPDQQGASNVQNIANRRVVEPRTQQGGSGSFRLVCNNPPTSVCGEYTFTSQADLDSFSSQCVSGGGQIMSGNCPVHPACKHSGNNRTVITYAYDRSAEFILKACLDSGDKSEYIGPSS